MIDEADYIVVGAGSAGCVLAAELSANPKHSVLVLESGPMDSSFLISMPRGIGKLLSPDNEHVWAYDIVKDQTGAKETWLKGRAIGGSSSINGMVYARGFAGDYDRWAAAGCTGWGSDSMLPHLIAHEDHAFGASLERGVGGPLRITGHPVDEAGADARGLCDAFLEASAQAGTPTVQDTNMASDGGAGYQPRNIYQGKRQSAAKAFLHPASSRPNLTIEHSVDVLRVVFKDKTVVGVEVADNSSPSGKKVIRCNREVILSAGAIESPKLLQLSGIGPAAKLAPLGVPIVVNSPNVGQNLREHYFMQMKYRVTKGSLNNNFQGPKLIWNVLRYLLVKNGPMANAAQECIAYIKTREGLSRPDCQLGAGLYSLENSPQGPVLDKQPGLTIGGYHMHPRSQGEVMITSADPGAKPYIFANYLADEEDQIVSVAMLRYIRNIAQQPALKDWIVNEFDPGNDYQSDAELLAAYRSLGMTAYHVSGTCRMGADDASVVDPQTKVRGVDGLRVVDSSIFPELISGNTNAATMAAGRNAAHMILNSK